MAEQNTKAELPRAGHTGGPSLKVTRSSEVTESRNLTAQHTRLHEAEPVLLGRCSSYRAEAAWEAGCRADTGANQLTSSAQQHAQKNVAKTESQCAEGAAGPTVKWCQEGRATEPSGSLGVTRKPRPTQGPVGSLPGAF